MIYKIPLFNLNYDKKEEQSVTKTLRSKWISMGPNVNKLEKVFANHLRVRYAVAVTNCTAALHLALKILGIEEGDEVIVPSLTFVATVNAIRYVNAIPVFADITSYDDFSIDPMDIKRKITSKTRAIIVMHYGGFSCEMDGIVKIARRHNLFIVEDAAHAPNSEYKSKKLGAIGDIGCFSFFSNKNITCAEGGILVTDNVKYAKKAKLLRSHGMTSMSYDREKGHVSRYDVLDLGFNYRMDDIRGALLLAQLKKLKDDIKRRIELRKLYIKEIGNIKDIIIPFRKHLYKSSNYIFPVLLRNSNIHKREQIRRKLDMAGIQTSVHYQAVHKLSIYKRFVCKLPQTEYVADNEITLPLFYNLKIEEIKYISKSFRKALKIL